MYFAQTLVYREFDTNAGLERTISVFHTNAGQERTIYALHTDAGLQRIWHRRWTRDLYTCMYFHTDAGLLGGIWKALDNRDLHLGCLYFTDYEMERLLLQCIIQENTMWEDFIGNTCTLNPIEIDQCKIK